MTIHAKSETVFHILYLAFMASIIFSLRAVSSLTIGVIIVAAVLTNPKGFLSVLKKSYLNYFLLCCILLFLLQFIAMFYTSDVESGWSNIRIKSGLVIIPLAVCLSSFLQTKSLKKLLSQFCLLLLLASLYCILVSFINYQHSGDSSLFFYHALVSPLKQHAVYFSILVTIAIIFLTEIIYEKEIVYSKWFHISLIIYFSIFLFLLSSRLIISLYIFYLVLFFIRLLKKKKINKVIIATFIAAVVFSVISIFTVRNPISQRFYDIVNGNLNIIRQDSFKKSDYFNGLQFRLLQWRFVAEILSEQDRWWLGVSPGDAQHLLNEKYLSKNMYAGERHRGDRGYLIYNTHNQFLQTLLQTGIIGLIILLFLCFFLVKTAWQRKNKMLINVVLILLIWLFTEAAFETQYGIAIFIFFPLLLAMGNDSDKKEANLLNNNYD